MTPLAARRPLARFTPRGKGAAVQWLHAALVLALVGATLTLWFFVGLHQAAGYAALAAVLARLAWAWRGPRPARLRPLLRSRHGWGALLRLACVLALAASGWLYTSDAYWGDAAVEAVHRAAAWLLLALVLAHLAEVARAAFRKA